MGKWVTTYKPNKVEKLITLIVTLLVTIYAQTQERKLRNLMYDFSP